MKWVRTALWACLLVVVAGCGNSGSGEQVQVGQAEPGMVPEPEPCTLVMGYDPWEPYQYEIAGGHVFGLDVDLLTLVSSHVGCDIAFERGTWRELLNQIREGDIDMLAGATRTPEREEFAWFTGTYRNEEFNFYVAVSGSEQYEDKGLEELLEDGVRVGVIDSYLYGDPVSALQDDPRFSEQFAYASIAEINIERLLDGEVDGIIEDKYVGASIIRHRSLQDFIMPHAMSLGQTGVSIMVSRASVDAARFAQIDDAVKKLKAEGAMDKVLVQYQNP